MILFTGNQPRNSFNPSLWVAKSPSSIRAPVPILTLAFFPKQTPASPRAATCLKPRKAEKARPYFYSEVDSLKTSPTTLKTSPFSTTSPSASLKPPQSWPPSNTPSPSTPKRPSWPDGRWPARRSTSSASPVRCDRRSGGGGRCRGFLQVPSGSFGFLWVPSTKCKHATGLAGTKASFGIDCQPGS